MSVALYPQEKPFCLSDGKEKKENGKMWVNRGQGQVTARSSGNMVTTLSPPLIPQKSNMVPGRQVSSDIL